MAGGAWSLRASEGRLQGGTLRLNVPLRSSHRPAISREIVSMGASVLWSGWRRRWLVDDEFIVGMSAPAAGVEVAEVDHGFPTGIGQDLTSVAGLGTEVEAANIRLRRR